MRFGAVICECNPPHGGHARLFEQVTRESDCVICLMSGAFVQRGEAAILSPAARAEILTGMGADLVLELPFPFAASSAEAFAAAGVSILSRLGATDLWFGSESGDLALLSRLASAAQSPAFRAEYAKRSGEGNTGTAAVYFQLLADFCGLQKPLSPNDILAIAYLRAIEEQQANLIPHAVKREGADDRDLTLSAQTIPSAAALRKAIFEGKTHTAFAFLSAFEQTILQKEEQAGRMPASLQNASAAVLWNLRQLPQEAFSGIAEASGGVGNRLQAAANEATDLSSLLAIAATKKYPNARLRRALLFLLTGVKREELFAPPAYTRLLAANKTGRAFLSAVRKTADIPVVTSNAGVPDFPAARRQEELAKKATSLYALCLPRPTSPAELLRQNPLIPGKAQNECARALDKSQKE